MYCVRAFFLIEHMYYSFNFRDNEALEELIEFLRGKGNQKLLVTKLEKSWKAHSGVECKFSEQSLRSHSSCIKTCLSS